MKTVTQLKGSKPYDPETCSFMIQCAVHRDGTNSPFTILSEISLCNLHTTIAEKLKLFPDCIILWYWLDSDKQKDGATSIQTSDELDLFKA
ncbi:hypothetical protein J3R82DRAFT_47 [Butyriboletus roseoflavus]|nr:hypothetical protein J3R82DRAFT_47 [Butyriboletus roseoflavus]